MSVDLGTFAIGGGQPLVLIAGPCQAESPEAMAAIADALDQIATRLDLPLIFKASFDKANRTSADAARGMGLEATLRAFDDIRRRTGRPVLTDVHLPEHCARVAEVVDVLQIPAFLCRQTDLLEAAARTGRALHIKKGQFLAPWDMEHVAAKCANAGNQRLILCDRGTSFGYNTLVSDFRGLPTMRALGYPVTFDATHSVQQPGGQGGRSGGQREFVPILARAAVAVGVDGLFIETHPDPDAALSDGPNMVPLAHMAALLEDLLAIDAVARARPAGR
ncbi:MAG: 3-deoxy-8-phosphooctulonate synthase, partial [Geminicoccus sp.]|nr:3-deoxy-8-phosphooctulonate synthase [Geminicoccus sp.]